MMTLPVDEVDEPLRAVKVADVRGRSRPRLHPIGRYRRWSYEHLSTTTARCHRRGHSAPALECSCGFHAAADFPDLAAATSIRPDSVVLCVELGGTIIEHERGYRAAQQTVLEVSFSRMCFWCGADAMAVVPSRVWRSACTDCASQRRRGALGRADAAARLGVDVTFDAPVSAPRRSDWMTVLRSAAMVALTAVPLLAARMVGRSTDVVLATAVAVCMSCVLCCGTFLARSPRANESRFIGQCLCLLAASFALKAGAR